MRGLVFVFVGAVVLVGLFVLIPKEQPDAAASSAQNATTAEQSPSPEAKHSDSARPKRLSWRIQDGVIQALATTPQVHKGDVVRIEVLSDTHDEVHLHGYDYTLPLQPELPGVLQFTAIHSGRFELELHHGHQVLGALTVLP
nr:hypothetical protein [Oceanococcus sp. HetDA_MAG_MS8]